MTLNGRPFRIYSDQVGSVRVVADEQGRVVQNIRYCSFGRLLEEANPGFPMPLGFAGGLHDRDIGWVRFGFRDYDPETGRFTAPDPMGYAAGDPDVYGYCLDDPVNNVDPAGLEGHPSGGYYPAVPRWDWDEELKRSKEREEKLERSKEKETEGGFWGSSGGRIIRSGLKSAAEGGIAGGSWGSAGGPWGVAGGAAGGAMIGGSVGMLKGVTREIFFGDSEDDPQLDPIEQRKEIPKDI